MKNFKTLVLVLLTLVSNLTFSQEEKKAVYPKGTGTIKIFANYHSNLGGNKSTELDEGMILKRVYLGYKVKLNENYSTKVVLDVDGKSGRYDAYLKTASLTYKKDKFSYNIGMISTTQFKVQEKFWGYRYLRKSFQDYYKYNASADLGLSLAYKFNNIIGIDAIIQNGNGYKDVTPSGTYRGGFGTTISYKHVTFRGYYDISAKPSINRQNIASFIGYKYKKKFRIGAEYNYQLNNSFTKDKKLFGYSVYATYIINDKFETFARLDNSNSNIINVCYGCFTDQWNAKKDEKIGIIGLQYKPIKNVNVSTNYRRSISALNGSDWVNWIFVNFEFKF